MTTYLVSFSTDNFAGAQHILGLTAKKFGIDIVVPYTKNWLIGTEFYKENKLLLDSARGSGYWAWKPFIILDAIKKANDGDIVMYSDSSVRFISSILPLFECCYKNNGRLLFANGGYKQSMYTKMDCFALMNCNSAEYYDAEHVTASYNLWVKNEKNIEFLEEYLYYCKNINIISDLPNICGQPNLPDFIDHRHDQSVLTQLVAKHKIELFRDPSQHGNCRKLPHLVINGEFGSPQCPEDNPRVTIKTILGNSNYPTIIEHHRIRISLDAADEYIKNWGI